MIVFVSGGARSGKSHYAENLALGFARGQSIGYIATGEAMDAEFEKRTAEKKRRNELKFKTKLRELKKRTMVETWKRDRAKGGSMAKHEHVWGAVVVNKKTGETIKTCEECGFELEEWVI